MPRLQGRQHHSQRTEHALAQGPALLPHLETVEADTSAMQDRPFRMAGVLPSA
jgi:hypothetical protein